MDFTIAKNNAFNSLEINFDGKPSEMVRNLLKKFGFRWHGVRRIWYGYGDENEILNALKGVADNLTGAAAARIQAQKDAIAREQIEKAAIVKDIPENERRIYFDLAEYRKINSLEEAEKVLEEYAKDGEPLPRVDAIPSRRVDFNGYTDNDKKIFANFCKMFMFDFTFLQGKGGQTAADERVNENNYKQLTSEQREGVKWYANDCIAVYNNGVLQFIINPEGFSYAQYILQLPEGFDEQADSENAAEWIANQKAETSKREPFYIPAPVIDLIAK